MVELLPAMTSFANAIEQQATFEVAWKFYSFIEQNCQIEAGCHRGA